MLGYNLTRKRIDEVSNLFHPNMHCYTTEAYPLRFQKKVIDQEITNDRFLKRSFFLGGINMKIQEKIKAIRKYLWSMNWILRKI